MMVPPTATANLTTARRTVDRARNLAVCARLVVAPPTRERVDQMIVYLGRRPDEVVGVLGPKDGIATIEQIAINCVMAGCLPQHAPVVIAAIEAMLEPEFNLHGVQATTNPCAPLVIDHLFPETSAREMLVQAAMNIIGDQNRGKGENDFLHH